MSLGSQTGLCLQLGSSLLLQPFQSFLLLLGSSQSLGLGVKLCLNFLAKFGLRLNPVLSFLERLGLCSLASISLSLEPGLRLGHEAFLLLLESGRLHLKGRSLFSVLLDLCVGSLELFFCRLSTGLCLLLHSLLSYELFLMESRLLLAHELTDGIAIAIRHVTLVDLVVELEALRKGLIPVR